MAAQLGKLLEQLSKASTAGNSASVVAGDNSTTGALSTGGILSETSIPIQSTTSSGDDGTFDSLLISALDKHDEDNARERAEQESERQKIEAERQLRMMMMEEEMLLGSSASGISTQDDTAMNSQGQDVQSGSGDMSWMGLGGVGELGGCEDFATLLDFTAFGSTESGNLFETENKPAQQTTTIVEHFGASDDNIDTSPLLTNLSSTVTSLLTSFETPEIAPGSTATQLFSEFSSPEEGNLGNMFPPMPVRYAGIDAFGKPLLAEDAKDNKGVFSLPLFAPTKAAGQEPLSGASEAIETIHIEQVTTTASAESQNSSIIASLPLLEAGSPADIYFSPVGSPMPSEFGAARTTKGRRKKPYEPTGTRNSKPLLDADAPTMTKTYAAPGKTTRKAIPVGFQKKLKLAADANGDAVVTDGAVPNEVMNEIEEKRRKNCVAARESRRRKLEYLTGLKSEISGWRQWAQQVEALVRDAGRSDLLSLLPPCPEAMELEE